MIYINIYIYIELLLDLLSVSYRGKHYKISVNFYRRLTETGDFPCSDCMGYKAREQLQTTPAHKRRAFISSRGGYAVKINDSGFLCLSRTKYYKVAMLLLIFSLTLEEILYLKRGILGFVVLSFFKCGVTVNKAEKLPYCSDAKPCNV